MAPKKEVPSIPAPEDPKPVKAPEKGEEQKAAEAIAAKEKRVKRYLDAMEKLGTLAQKADSPEWQRGFEKLEANEKGYYEVGGYFINIENHELGSIITMAKVVKGEKGEEKAKVARMLLNPVQTFLTVDGATIIEGSLDTREKARMSIHKTEEIEQFGKLLKKLIRLVDADVQKKLDEEQAERLEKLGDF